MPDERQRVDLDAAKLWSLKDERTVRLNMPPVNIAGHDEALRIYFELDAAAVDDVIARLVGLRAKMVPKRN